MFTCCPNCETVFKVGAKHLQQAAGKVRCGQCEFSFNALSNIQESASEAAANLKTLGEKGEDTETPPVAANDEQIANPDEVVLVEDAEAFEAAVLATIHATESKAWESSGPHFVVVDDDADTPPDEPDKGESVQAEPAAADDDQAKDEHGAAEPMEDAPDASEDDAWLSSEAQDADLDEDPDQPNMDFLNRLAEGADEEAGLEDISVDDEDESQKLADGQPLEDKDTDESEEAFDDVLPENDAISDPDVLKDEEISENEDVDESTALVDDDSEAPPDEEPGEEGSISKEFSRGADVAHAEGDSDSGSEEIWLGEITLESAQKDELEFDVPGDQIDSVFMAADAEPPTSDDDNEIEPESAVEPSEEMIDLSTGGTEEIILASDDILDLEPTETETKLGLTPVVTIKRRFTLLSKYRRPVTIAGAVALAFLLLAQLTYYFRHQILESDSLGPLLETVYSGLGIQLARAWDLDAYNIRRTIGVGSETGDSVVQISAILSNRATFAQPYPILRLIFTNQWDEALAIRDMNAGEYLQTYPGDQARMAAGEQVAVDIQVLELENKLAQSYRIEICLHDSDENLRCK